MDVFGGGSLLGNRMFQYFSGCLKSETEIEGELNGMENELHEFLSRLVVVKKVELLAILNGIVLLAENERFVSRNSSVERRNIGWRLESDYRLRPSTYVTGQ